MNHWIAIAANPPPANADINDLILWCPKNKYGLEVVVGQFDGHRYTVFFQTNTAGDYITREVKPSHWKDAEFLGPTVNPVITPITDLPVN